MFNYFKNKERKRRELKFNTLHQYNGILDRCNYGTFEFSVFTKAIEMLKADTNPKDVIKWVGTMESNWNKF